MRRQPTKWQHSKFNHDINSAALLIWNCRQCCSKTVSNNEIFIRITKYFSCIFKMRELILKHFVFRKLGYTFCGRIYRSQKSRNPSGQLIISQSISFQILFPVCFRFFFTGITTCLNESDHLENLKISGKIKQIMHSGDL